MRRARAVAVTLAGAALALLILAGTGGCSTVGYYALAAQGHFDLLSQARPVDEVLHDSTTSATLRDRLVLSQQVRDYAITELHLPDNRSYRRYADLHRPAALWNVVAAPELSVQLRTWCFAVVGCIGYRGYYELARAEALATELKAEGDEVSVYPVPAYSTLGWSNWLGGDPLLNTFILWPDSELARLLFHELAHQVVYVDGDTAFNESFATAVERLGLARWLPAHATDATRAEAQRIEQRRADFRRLTLHYRDRLDQLYRSDANVEDKRAGKAALYAELRAEHQRLKTEVWGGYTGYDRWFELANNASLGVQAAYEGHVPAFERLYTQQGGDWLRFYAEVRRLAALSRAERDAALRTLATP